MNKNSVISHFFKKFQAGTARNRSDAITIHNRVLVYTVQNEFQKHPPQTTFYSKSIFKIYLGWVALKRAVCFYKSTKFIENPLKISNKNRNNLLAAVLGPGFLGFRDTVLGEFTLEAQLDGSAHVVAGDDLSSSSFGQKSSFGPQFGVLVFDHGLDHAQSFVADVHAWVNLFLDLHDGTSGWDLLAGSEESRFFSDFLGGFHF